MAEIIIGKQRNGPIGTVKLTFLKPLTRFDNLAAGGSVRVLMLSLRLTARRHTVYIYSMSSSTNGHKQPAASQPPPATLMFAPIKGRGTAWAIEHRFSTRQRRVVRRRLGHAGAGRARGAARARARRSSRSASSRS